MHGYLDYGYHPEPSKKVLIVVPSDIQQASELFAGLGIKIISGAQFLGGFIGEDSLTVLLLPVKCTYGSTVLVSWLMWLFLNLKLSHAVLARSLKYE